MRALTPVVLVVGIAVGLAAADLAGGKPSTYVDGTYGFSLNPPRFPKVDRHTATVLQVSAPPADGFEANQNIQVQPMNMDRDQFRALSLGQFKKEGWKVNVDKDLTVSGHDAILWDFEGTDDGREYRWLSLAVIAKPNVFMTTCTALKGDFPAQEKEFRASLDSFRLVE